MSETISQQDLQDEFMEDFKQPIGQIKQKLNPQAQRIKLPPLTDMDEVLTDLKNHGDGWGKTLPKKGGKKSRSHKKRKKTKKRTHKKRKAKRDTKRRATRSA